MSGLFFEKSAHLGRPVSGAHAEPDGGSASFGEGAIRKRGTQSEGNDIRERLVCVPRRHGERTFRRSFQVGVVEEIVNPLASAAPGTQINAPQLARVFG
jgi:hypothetical protein